MYSRSSEEKEQNKEQEKEELCVEKNKELPEPLIIDHSSDPKKDGFIVPTNKIIRFTEDPDNDIDAISMKVEPEPFIYGQNTNTPTINAQTKKKRTRRGKRSGKKKSSNISFMDFISNEPPSVLAPSCHTSYIEPSSDVVPSVPEIPKLEQDDSIVASKVEQNEPTDKTNNLHNNTNNETQKYVPCIQDVIRYQRLYMDYSTSSPAIKEVEGRITKLGCRTIVIFSISGDIVYVYLLEEDEMDQVLLFVKIL